MLSGQACGQNSQERRLDGSIAAPEADLSFKTMLSTPARGRGASACFGMRMGVNAGAF